MRMKRVLSKVSYLAYLAIFVEVAVRLALHNPRVLERFWEESDVYWWRRMWINRHRESGIQVYFSFDIYDSTKGWISKPGLRDMRVFRHKILNTNSRGLRGQSDYAYGKNPEKVRILIFGDSFTFGDEVSDDETYAHYLQQMLPQAEIINMGFHGYGHDQMLVLLQEEGVKYEPDIVILGFVHLDMSRNLLNFRDYAKPKYVLDDGELKLTGVPVPRPEEVVKGDWSRFRAFELCSIIRHRLLRSSAATQKKKEAITAAILTEFARTANRIGAIPVLAYLPFGDEISDSISLTQNERFLFSWCQSNGKVRYLSTRSLFAKESSQKESFQRRVHWGPEGHLVVATAIEQYLTAEGLIGIHQSPLKTEIMMSDPARERRP
jgi:hypothetical protein